MNRPAALAVVAVAGVAALAVGVGGWTNSEAKTSRETFEQKITEVRLDSGSGDVTIIADGDGKVEVEQRVRKFWFFPAKPKKLEVDGEALVIPDGCGVNCSIDYTIKVPDGTKVTGDAAAGTLDLDGVASVDVELSSGDVHLTNVGGPVNVETNSGSVDADHVRGDATIRTHSGDIKVDDVTGRTNLRANSGTINADNLREPVEAETNSGDIRVDLSAPTSVRAKASSGSIDLLVPEGAYKVATHTSSGESEVRIPTDSNAQNSLDANTSSGEIRIERS
jgi:hypothetical protein